MHPLGRSPPVTKSAKLLCPPPRVDHLAASGRATLACPPDGRDAPHRDAPGGAAAQCIGSARARNSALVQQDSRSLVWERDSRYDGLALSLAACLGEWSADSRRSEPSVTILNLALNTV